MSDVSIAVAEASPLLARKEELLRSFALMLTGNMSAPSVVGGAYQQHRDGTRHNPQAIDLARWPSGQFTKRTPAYLVGMVSIRPQMHAERALKALGSSNCQPLVSLLAAAGWIVPDGQRPEILSNNDGSLTIVAPWPAELQNEVGLRGVSLNDLGGIEAANKRGRLAFCADTSGDVLTARFGVSKAGDPSCLFHLLISGGTGYGKTWFMISLAAQLARARRFVTEDDGDTHVLDEPGCGIAIVDFKGADGIGYLRNIPNQLFPTVCQDYDGARGALLWFFNEIKHRDARMKEARQRYCTERPLYLFFSEFPKLVAERPLGIGDAASIFMLNALVKEGRAYNIHVILDTQHARGSLFGDTTTRSQFDDAVVFKPQGALDAAGVIPAALGVNPYLTLGTPGDCYVVLGARVRRGFAVHAPDATTHALIDSTAPQMAAVPEFDANDLEGFEPPRGPGQPEKGFSASEIAVALAALKQPGEKRALLRREFGSISNDRARALLALARELATELEARSYCRPSAYSTVAENGD